MNNYHMNEHFPGEVALVKNTGLSLEQKRISQKL